VVKRETPLPLSLSPLVPRGEREIICLCVLPKGGGSQTRLCPGLLSHASIDDLRDFVLLQRKLCREHWFMFGPCHVGKIRYSLMCPAKESREKGKVILQVGDRKLAASKRLKIQTMQCPSAPPADLEVPGLKVRVECEFRSAP